MKRVQITEIKAKLLQQEIKALEELISNAHSEHGEAAKEEGGLFRNSAIHTISQDIARWTSEINRMRNLLSTAEIVKIDMESDAATVEVGDVVAVKITYEGEEPEELKLQIDGTMKLSGIVRVTFASPLAKALLGKEIGEDFVLRKSSGSPTNADGIITGIVKAKDLESSIGEVESKKPYTLKKHS